MLGELVNMLYWLPPHLGNVRLFKVSFKCDVDIYMCVFSGKSIAYQVPTLKLLEESATSTNEQKARILWLFPTKALARDQWSNIRELIHAHNMLCDWAEVSDA
jgi:hypothetical protein